MYEPREEKEMFDGGRIEGLFGGELGYEAGKVD